MSTSDLQTPTQLEGGLVPAGKRCPYASRCHVATSCPTTKPQGNSVDYSCGLARAFDIVWRPNLANYLSPELPPDGLEDDADAARDELHKAAKEFARCDALADGFTKYSRVANRLENAAIAYGRMYSANAELRDRSGSGTPTHPKPTE